MYENDNNRISIDTDSAKKIKKGVYQVRLKKEDFWIHSNNGAGIVETYLAELTEDTRDVFKARKEYYGDHWLGGRGKGTTDVLSIGTTYSIGYNDVEPRKIGIGNGVALDHWGSIYILSYLNHRFGDGSILEPEFKWYHSTDETTCTYDANSIVYRNGVYYVWTRDHYPYLNPERVRECPYSYTGWEFEEGDVVRYRVLISHGMMKTSYWRWGELKLIDNNIEAKRLYEAIVAEKNSGRKIRH